MVCQLKKDQKRIPDEDMVNVYFTILKECLEKAY